MTLRTGPTPDSLNKRSVHGKRSRGSGHHKGRLNPAQACIVLAAILLAPLCHAAGEAASDWTTVYEADFAGDWSFSDWVPMLGEWTQTPDGIRSSVSRIRTSSTSPGSAPST